MLTSTPQTPNSRISADSDSKSHKSPKPRLSFGSSIGNSVRKLLSSDDKSRKKAHLTLLTLNSALLSLTPELFEKYLNKIPSHKFMTQIFQNVSTEVEKVFWWEDKRSFEIF